MLRQISCAVAAIGVLLSSSPLAQTPLIAPGSKVFLQRMDRAFEDDVTVALIGARVPLVVVNDRKDADFEISGRLRERGDSTYSRDWEATLTVTAIRTAVVVDAFTLTQDSVEKLARACAKRLYEHIAFPQPTALVARPAPPPPAPVGSPPAAPASSGVVRLFVQGDFNRLADFVERLRTELRAGGSSPMSSSAARSTTTTSCSSRRTTRRLPSRLIVTECWSPRSLIPAFERRA